MSTGDSPLHHPDYTATNGVRATDRRRIRVLTEEAMLRVTAAREERDAISADRERLANELVLVRQERDLYQAVAEAARVLAKDEEWEIVEHTVGRSLIYVNGPEGRLAIAQALVAAGLDWHEPKEPTIGGFATDADIEAWGL